jgi:transcriptional regulator with XRE-family HTH domain
MMTVIFKVEQDILKNISAQAKLLRLSQNLTQESLSEKSGVSLGSLKRFETSGEISLKSLIKIAYALGNTEQFESLFQRSTDFESLDQVKKLSHQRKRARKK